MFDFRQTAGGWEIVTREGPAGRMKVLLSSTEADGEAVLRAVRIAYNLGLKKEATTRAAVLQSLLRGDPAVM
jgi:hypothetical protein